MYSWNSRFQWNAPIGVNCFLGPFTNYPLCFPIFFLTAVLRSKLFYVLGTNNIIVSGEKNLSMSFFKQTFFSEKNSVVLFTFIFGFS